MKSGVRISSFAVLFVAATRLMAATLSPACDAANRQALTLLANERASEAQVQLSQFVSKLGGSADDELCLGFALSNLASALERLGRLDLAEQAAERSVNLLEETLGPNAPSLRAPLRLLTVIAIEKGQFSKAGNLLSRAESLPSPTHADLAVTKGLRATLLVKAGSLAEAEAAFGQSIIEREQAGQAEMPEVAPELCNLAVLYLNEGRVPEALVLLERSLRISETFPSDTDTRVKTMLDLAVAQSMRRDSKEAETYFRRAMNLIGSLPPALRPEMGRTVYLRYSLFLRSTGRKREADAVAQKAYALFGPDSSTMVVGLDSLRAMSTQR